MVRSYESEECKSRSSDSFRVFKGLNQKYIYIKAGESEKEKHFSVVLSSWMKSMRSRFGRPQVPTLTTHSLPIKQYKHRLTHKQSLFVACRPWSSEEESPGRPCHSHILHRLQFYSHSVSLCLSL